MAKLVLTATQQAKVSVTWKDARGNPASVDPGTTDWGSTDPSIVTITEDPTDESSALIAAVGPVGSAQISVTAQENGNPIADTGDVDVLEGTAISASLTFGTPEEQP